MKKTLTYIITILCGSALASCSLDDINPQETGKGRYIEFIARPTSFNVSIGETKALTSDQLTAVEKNIYSLYFIVFDKNGDRIANLSGNLPTTTTSQTLYHDHGGEITVCYLANVSAEYANSLQTLEDLSTKPITIEYDTYAKTGYLGIPLIDVSTTGTPDKKNCIPMFGSYTLSITDGAITGATTSNNVTQVTIPLERLFAKVTVKVKSEMDDADWGINLNPPSIDISKYILINLPKKVYPAAALGVGDVILQESNWASTDFKNETINLSSPLTIADGRVSLGDLWESNGDYVEIVTCYIPEYAVAPTGNNTDQKLKPNFVASTKYPVHFTLTGIAKQEKFVDVPVEYHIYFGEDAFDNFNLRRNTWYNTNLLIKGTSDAVIGVDQRVEATYHNLADPNRTGTDDPANCYIISKPGRYLLPTYKGNDVNGDTLDGTVDANSVISLNGSTNNRIDNIEFKTIGGKHYIQFDVNMYDTDGKTVKLTDVAAGNKLLTLKQNGNIIWSWHLWFCEDGKRPDSIHNTYTGSDSKNYEMMNRALGATTSVGVENRNIPLVGTVSIVVWTDGLYYQWGRKDPMIPSGNTVNTEESIGYLESIKNPRTFYTKWAGIYSGETIGWTSSKSINDPCPSGYMIPQGNIWKSKSSNNGTMEKIVEGLTSIFGFDVFAYDVGLRTDLSANIAYSYSSYIDSAANSDALKSDQNGQVVQIRDVQKVSGQNTTEKYTATDFDLYYTMKPAYLWTSNNYTAINYSKKVSEKSIYIYNGTKQTKKIYQISWGSESAYTGKVTAGTVDLTSNFYDTDSNPKSAYSNNFNGLSAADGLQVRCVKIE